MPSRFARVALATTFLLAACTADGLYWRGKLSRSDARAVAMARDAIAEGDIAEARRIHENIAVRGQPAVLLQLGRLLLDERGGPVEAERAADLIARAYAKNSPHRARAAFFLAKFYGDGGGGRTADARHAFALYQEAYRGGVDAAAYRLGQAYEQGLGTKADPARAATLYREAVQQRGDIGAMIGLARLAELRGDTAEVLSAYRMAAERGHVGAMAELARRHLRGEFGPLSRPEEGRRWAERAIALNHRPTMYVFGAAFLKGQGVPADPTRGAELLGAAASQGSKPAMHLLGLALLTGDVLARDPERGAALLEQAAAAGRHSSAAELGHRYLSGKGVPLDPERGIALLTPAAEQGHALSMLHLGRAYALGLGVERDPAKARQWLSRARDGGYASAERYLKSL